MKKRWRAWLRAIHRDFGYLAIGFTVIYAVSGIAQNHIEDWGDVSFKSTERTITIAAIPDATPEIVAVKAVADAVGLGTPVAHSRAGDEIRLDDANGSKVTAIGTTVTIQTRARRPFIGLANWLHTARHKKAWKYIADTYAVLLLYLAMSGIFMIKGKLGLKWRGSILISTGIAVPVLYIALAGGPNAQKEAVANTELRSVPVGLGPKVRSEPEPEPEPEPAVAPVEIKGPGSAVLVPLPPDDDH
ncbi:MAG TPA: PepSY-associated TM helix domain-containing protein [Kofleriaceae bacterium]|nr:PepSY-associated TM helix domain-containing protein [Kofleriaceae bacterium]